MDIAAASDSLGISREAVRKRIRRGALSAEKREGRWFVRLDTRPDTGPDTSWTEQDARPGHGYDKPDALVDQLQRENVRLWEELEARREEIRRRDVLVAQQQDVITSLSHQVQALSAGPEATESIQGDDNQQHDRDTGQAAERPWWRFWGA